MYYVTTRRFVVLCFFFNLSVSFRNHMLHVILYFCNYEHMVLNITVLYILNKQPCDKKLRVGKLIVQTRCMLNIQSVFFTL